MNDWLAEKRMTEAQQSLRYYLKLIADKAGVTLSSDSYSEIDDIVESTVRAAIEETADKLSSLEVRIAALEAAEGGE